MPDYNKGDFTQQGYDGYVSGGLHLNEKRCLTARISTDEDSAGLDSVEINIHDHLNDLDYTFSGENVIAGTSVIGQAPSGNIEITENGENINVAPYATATVNVSGGLPTTKLTIINSTGEEIRNASFDTLQLTENAVKPMPDLLENETAETNVVYLYVEMMGDVFYKISPLYETQNQDVLIYTYSDLVNCTTRIGSQLVITDSSQNSSATLTITKEIQ